MYIFILPSTNLMTVIHTESEFIRNLRVESSKPCLIHIGVQRGPDALILPQHLPTPS